MKQIMSIVTKSCSYTLIILIILQFDETMIVYVLMGKLNLMYMEYRCKAHSR